MMTPSQLEQLKQDDTLKPTAQELLVSLLDLAGKHLISPLPPAPSTSLPSLSSMRHLTLRS